MSYHAHEVKVGVVVLIGLVLFALVLASLAGIQELWTPYRRFHVVFADVQGLKVGAEVRLAGLTVGSVEAIGFDQLGGRYRATVALRLQPEAAEKLKPLVGREVDADGLAPHLPGVQKEADGTLWVRMEGPGQPADGRGLKLGRLERLRVTAPASAEVHVDEVPVERLAWLKEGRRPVLRLGPAPLGATTGCEASEVTPPQAAVRVTCRVPASAAQRLRTGARVVVLKALTGQVVVNVEHSGEGSPLEPEGVLYGPETTAFYEVAKELGVGEAQRQDLATILSNIAKLTTDISQWLNANSDSFTQSVTNLRNAAGRTDALLKEISPQVTATVENTRKVTADAVDVVGRLGRQLEAAAENIRRATADVEQLVAENRPVVLDTTQGVRRFVENVNAEVNREALRTVVSNVQKASASLTEALELARRTLGQGHDLLAENRPAVQRLIGRLESTADWLRLAAKEIYTHPWRLLRKPEATSEQARDLYRAAREFSEGASDVEEAAGQLRLLLSVTPAAATQAWARQVETTRQELEAMFQRLKEAEEKFLKKVGSQPAP